MMQSSSHDHDHGHDHHGHSHNHSHDHGHNHAHDGIDNDNDDAAERAHVLKVMTAFGAYRAASTRTLESKLAVLQRPSVPSVPSVPSTAAPAQGEQLAGAQHTPAAAATAKAAADVYAPVRRRLRSHRHAINHNAHFLSLISEMHRHSFLDSVLHDGGSDSSAENGIDSSVHSSTVAGRQAPAASEADMDKVRSTLRQFVRDWSADGAMERQQAYDPILNHLEDAFKDVPASDRGNVRILVPGAGLGRLVFEIVRKGFSCQGNEFSMFMLLASNFALNNMPESNLYTIYPWIHSFSNIVSEANQMQPVQIPDVPVRDIPLTADFSMVAGDFVEIYSDDAQAGQWDAIVTCFFMDTAKDMTRYISVIRHALRKGGIWINLGPLLYHFEGDQSIEFTLEEVKGIAKSFDFSFEKEGMAQCTYASSPAAMLQYVYNCAFWVAVRM
ncbi:N2227-like protein-domain-containing protein [Entophlyctis helioformis]|nr:N2227-like protein-domain-containing protein [Entophlyctis helioformis]